MFLPPLLVARGSSFSLHGPWRRDSRCALKKTRNVELKVDFSSCSNDENG